jgi:hypothetical protein
MENAERIDASELSSLEISDVMSMEPGDEFFWVPFGDYEILVRLREGANPHACATACSVFGLVELPEEWDRTCREKTVNGERLFGVFRGEEAQE